VGPTAVVISYLLTFSLLGVKIPLGLVSAGLFHPTYAFLPLLLLLLLLLLLELLLFVILIIITITTTTTIIIIVITIIIVFIIDSVIT